MMIEIIVGLTKTNKIRKVQKVMSKQEIKELGLINIEGIKYVSKENYEGVAKVMNIKNEKEVVEMVNAVESYMGYVKEKVDFAIKFAIKEGKEAQSDVKYVGAKQLDAIFKSYKEVTGVEMTNNQILCVRALNPKQISNVLHTLNTSKKEFIAHKELNELQDEFKRATGDELTKKEIYELSKMRKVERLAYMRYITKIA